MPLNLGGELAWWCPSLDTTGNGTTTLYDLAGSNNGVLTNMDAATDWVADTGSGGVRALDFDGSNDRVQAGSAFASFSGSVFCSAWIKPSASKDDAAVFTTRNVLTGASRNGVALYWRDSAANNVSFEVVHSGTRHTAKLATTLSLGTWYFIYGSRSVSTGEVKVGVYGIGEATAGTTTTATITHEVTPTIGGFRDFNHFQGRIDDVRFFTSIPADLTGIASKRGYEPEISRLFNGGPLRNRMLNGSLLR